VCWASPKKSKVVYKRIEKGKPSPVTGYVLSDKAMAELLASHKKEVNELKLKLEYEAKKCKEKMETLRRVCKVQLESADLKYKSLEKLCESKGDIYKKALQRTVDSCRRKWYESPYLNLALGMAICGASVGVGVSID
jgi:hypothetical protein